MECNKDEADRSLQIALNKFHEKDILGAKRFALRAQELLPELEGIQQFIETLNVHISATKIHGEMDWYGILRVNPSDDEEGIEKSYRKMLLMLHPDKNKWDGADDAFHLVSEAWTVLSNKDRRAAYDHTRKGKQTSQDPPITGVNTSSSVPFSSNDSSIFNKNTINPTSPPTAPCSRPAAKSKPEKGTVRSNPNPQARQETSHSKSKKVSPSQPDTFWTACPQCKFKYEFQRIYVNAKLVCPGSECKKIFTATETSSPWGMKKSEKKESESRKRQKSNKFTASGDLPTSSPPAFKTPQVPSFSTKTAVTPVSATAPPEPGKRSENLIREEQAILFHRNTYCRNGKRAGTRPQIDLGSDGNPTKIRCVNGKATSKDVSCENEESVSLANKPVKKIEEVPHLKANEVLTKIAKVAIGKKLIEWKNITAAATLKKPRKVRSSGVKGRKLKGSSSFIAKKVDEVEVPFPPTISSSTAMEVPEQDFHKFGNSANLKFEKGQVWALYDDQHGMPRLYAAVESVVSQEPFEVKLRPLQSKSNEEFGPIEWISSGFHKTSGVFRRGKLESADVELCFSHIVSCKRDSRGVIYIYPKKGDVWAVYRNWSPEWDKHVLCSPEVFNQYDIVEVLQDYTEETGVTVAPLVKVPGFKSVLKRNSDPASHMTFPKHEIFRLSHQVPFCLLTEDNYPSAPTGCIEIDLAAIPSEFAEMIPEQNITNEP